MSFHMSLRLPEELAAQLREASAEDGQSMNKAVVQAVTEWMERRTMGHTLEVADRIIDRHSELLDMLGNS